jgi:hypothetical protein
MPLKPMLPHLGSPVRSLKPRTGFSGHTLGKIKKNEKHAQGD